MMRQLTTGVLILGSLHAGVGLAEQLYVGDKLVVGVYPDVDSENGKLANLETGDAVEALERADKYIRVRLSDGREGWVKANYLTAQPPAIVRLRELQAAGAMPTPPPSSAPSPQVTQELAQLKETNAALLKEVDALKQAAAKKPEAAAAMPLPPPALVRDEPRTKDDGEPESESSIWMWLGAIAATGIAGFAVGYQTFARRIRQKYGSVKII